MKVRLGQNQPVEEYPRSMKVTLIDDKGLDTSIKAKELLTDRFILNLKIKLVGIVESTITPQDNNTVSMFISRMDTELVPLLKRFSFYMLTTNRNIDDMKKEFASLVLNYVKLDYYMRSRLLNERYNINYFIEVIEDCF